MEKAKLHVADSRYNLARAIEKQAMVWQKQGRLEDAKSETSRALEVYQNLGLSDDVEDCEEMLREIEGQIAQRKDTSKGEFGSNSGLSSYSLLTLLHQCLIKCLIHHPTRTSGALFLSFPTFSNGKNVPPVLLKRMALRVSDCTHLVGYLISERNAIRCFYRSPFPSLFFLKCTADLTRPFFCSLLKVTELFLTSYLPCYIWFPSLFLLGNLRF
jgi:hypothetical protein